MENKELRLLPEQRPDVHRRQIHLSDLPANNELLGPEPTAELIESIRTVGLLQPAVLGQRNDDYHVHGGRRRIKAMRILALQWEKMKDSNEGVEEANNPFEYIDSYVVEDDGYTAHQTLTILLHSTQRPNAVAELDAIEDLVKQGADYEQIHRATGLPVVTIKSRMRLTFLEPELKTGLREGKMKATTAEKASRLGTKAQGRLVDLMHENGHVTGKMAEEQQRARTQQAASSTSFDLSSMPGVDSISDYQEESTETAQDSTAPLRVDPEIISYLNNRLTDIHIASSKSRPKWNARDIEMVTRLLEKLG